MHTRSILRTAALVVVDLVVVEERSKSRQHQFFSSFFFLGCTLLELQRPRLLRQLKAAFELSARLSFSLSLSGEEERTEAFRYIRVGWLYNVKLKARWPRESLLRGSRKGTGSRRVPTFFSPKPLLLLCQPSLAATSSVDPCWLFLFTRLSSSPPVVVPLQALLEGGKRPPAASVSVPTCERRFTYCQTKKATTSRASWFFALLCLL